METNSFKCSDCGEFTRHIELSLREAWDIDLDGDTGDTGVEKFLYGYNKVMSRIGDTIGVGKFNKHILGFAPYKCCKCGRCTWRDSKGEERNLIGYSH